ncbi:MAG: hypothetical protein IME95_07635, partial [Proteobacteria bacterium]|nr:hypothetical protein [Pseudomonadota bacterium]
MADDEPGSCTRAGSPMNSRKVSKIRRPGSQSHLTAGARQLDLICLSEEQIHQIKGARNLLRDVVDNCAKHLNLSFAVLILRDKEITLRSESEDEPLANSYKLIRRLDEKLAGWLLKANKGAVADIDTLTDVSDLNTLIPCKCIVAPVVVGEDRIEGILAFANNPDSPDFGKRACTQQQAIAVNMSSIVEAHFDSLTGLANRDEFE